MTCIVAIADQGKIWMGCDTLASNGDYGITKDTKIVKKDNIIMGFSGRVRDLNLLRFGFEIPDQEKDMDDYEYMATVFTTAVRNRLKEYGAAIIRDQEEWANFSALIGYKNNLYKLGGDFSVIRVHDTKYFATGSGRGLALGSLHSTENLQIEPRHRLVMALQASEKFINTVGGPFVVECLE